MAIICPTVTADSEHTYRTQMERVEKLSTRIHIDLADGKFTKKLVDPKKIWWPDTVFADVHLMFSEPARILKDLVKLHPNLIIVHAEADGNFITIAEEIRSENIRVGVALLQKTPVQMIAPAINLIDHVLIFSGYLGHFGGEADLDLTSKITEVRKLKSSIEVGWDGGINETNVQKLVEDGVDVLNVGGNIQRSDNPQTAYTKLEELIA